MLRGIERAVRQRSMDDASLERADEKQGLMEIRYLVTPPARHISRPCPETSPWMFKRGVSRWCRPCAERSRHRGRASRPRNPAWCRYRRAARPRAGATLRISSDAEQLRHVARAHRHRRRRHRRHRRRGRAARARPRSGRHVGERTAHGLVLDENPAALRVGLHLAGGVFGTARARARGFRRLDHLAGHEIDASAGERIVLGQEMIHRHPHVLEHQLAVVIEPAAERLVAGGAMRACPACRAAPGTTTCPAACRLWCWCWRRPRTGRRRSRSR